MSNRIRKLRSFKTKEKYVPIQKESVTWKSGTMEDILATSVVLVVIIFILVSMIHFIKIMETKRYINAYTRDYMLILESEGCLSNSDVNSLKTSVASLGFDKSHIDVTFNKKEDGTSGKKANYGEEVNLTVELNTNYKELGLTKIDGVIRENYCISKTVYSTSKK